MCTLQVSTDDLGQDLSNGLGKNDKTKALLNDLVYMVRCMMVGAVTITSQGNDKTVWRIQSPKKSPIVTLQYENECSEQIEDDRINDAVEIKVEPNDEDEVCYEFQTTSDSLISSLNEPEICIDEHPEIKLVPVSVIESTDRNTESCASVSQQTPCKTEIDAAYGKINIVEEIAVGDRKQLETEDAENRLTPSPMYRKESFFNAADEIFVVDHRSNQSVSVDDQSLGFDSLRNITQGKNLPVLLPSSNAIGSAVSEDHGVIGAGKGTYPCSSCDKKLSNLENLRIHERIHSGDRLHQCSYCEKSFPLATTLKVHERTHTGERPYQCSYCKKCFKQIAHVKVHIKIHTGERPYQCCYCEKSFTQLNTLKEHKNIHTGERPYQCSHCENSFKHLKTLKVHERTHTGERPYRCSYCAKPFMHWNGLKVHERTHTRNKPCKYSNRDVESHSHS